MMIVQLVKITSRLGEINERVAIKRWYLKAKGG
jgi:hypothetical protein